MDYKHFSEKCNICPCRTCVNAYLLEIEAESCINWCEKKCKGTKTVLKSMANSCYKPLH